MIEEMLLTWKEVAKKSGKRGWVLVKDGVVVGVYQEKKDAVMSAKEPGVYLLMHLE
ncbi:MAG: hypothetical protein QXH63_01875 [Pyrobaculum sp.]